MKTLYIIPLLLLVGCSAMSAQTTNSPTNTNTPTHRKTMSYTLMFEESKTTIPNPTEADIRAAVTSYKDFEIDLSGTEDFLRITVSGRAFSFDGKDGNVGYMTKKDVVSIEEAVKIMTAYRNGSADWKKMVDWDQIKQ